MYCMLKWSRDIVEVAVDGRRVRAVALLVLESCLRYIVEDVLQVDLAGGKMPAEEGGMCGEDGGYGEASLPTQNQSDGGDPLVKVDHNLDGRGKLGSNLKKGMPNCTGLSRGDRWLFGPTRKSSPWGNFSDGGLNQSIKRRLSS